jgi:mitochondrial fission protein ELM1
MRAFVAHPVRVQRTRGVDWRERSEVGVEIGVKGARATLRGRVAWMISDGKAGNDVQSRGVLEALGVEIVVKSVEPTGLQRLFSPWAKVASRERFGEPGTAFAPPWPDIATAIGRLTTPYIRELKRRAGSAVFTVILQNPKVPLATADLFWVPEHDRLRGPNVITTLTAPHSFDAQRLSDLRRTLPPVIARLAPPRVAVMLGGSNGDYTYTRAALARLAGVLRGLAEQGASLLITPSRRTEPAIVQCVREATRDARCFVWDMTGENPYPYFLAHADAFLAPADSVNMTGEPCATGKPVYVFHPDGGSPKFRRFHEALERYGATRPVREDLGALQVWSYEPLHSARAIADEINRRWSDAQATGIESALPGTVAGK